MDNQGEKRVLRNLEQVRAFNAMTASKKPAIKAEYVKKIPAMIIQNGLLGALAFALEKGDEYKVIFTSLIEHLAAKEIKLNVQTNANDLESFMTGLAQQSSAKLRAVTAESLAYFNYLRRFAGKKKEEDNG